MDELVFDVPKDEEEQLKALVIKKNELCHAIESALIGRSRSW